MYLLYAVNMIEARCRVDGIEDRDDMMKMEISCCEKGKRKRLVGMIINPQMLSIILLLFFFLFLFRDCRGT